MGYFIFSPSHLNQATFSCMRYLFSFAFSFLFLTGFSQSLTTKKYTVSGYVKDANTGEYLIGTNVYIKELLKGAQTNTYGFYSISVDEGNYTLIVSFVGYIEQQIPVYLNKDVQVNIDLGSRAIETKEVLISGEKADKNVSSTQMGKSTLDIEQIKTLPAFLGEVDILKSIQLLPGVRSSGEGNSGFYVRGGGPDQNLILLDEALVYNAAHLFGFFSVFNADAIKNVSLTKGGMPAQYGGRLSSVLDITMKEGNSKNYKVDGGIGPIASRLTVQGPIKKDTASFIISARRTFVDLFLRKPFIKDDSPVSGNSYYFYDLNTKINWRLSQKDRLFLSGYFGRDVFKFKSSDTGFKVRIPWGNATASLRWNHLFSDRMFVNTSLIFTDYNFSFGAEQQQFEFKIFSGVRDYNAKIDFNYYPVITHNVKFGANYVFHRFTPTGVQARSGDVDFDLGGVVRLYSHEGAAYINDDWDVSDKFSLSAGARYSVFEQVGPFNRYIKNEDNETIDTIHYSTNEKMAFYHHVEPRVSTKYSLNKTSSLKASFTQNYQYVHMASLSSTSLPTDVWVPSSTRVKPQFSTQYALGFFKNLKDNLYETSVEVYYKDMRNQIEYKEGAQPDEDVNNNSDNNFVFGRGWSYGAEFFIKKTQGKFNGWVGYTWSKTERKFSDINKGDVFPAKYDRRHDVSVVASCNLNKKWTFGLVWVYGSGSTQTLPVGRMFLFGPLDLNGLVNVASNGISTGQLYEQYGTRNSYRMIAYHRLDLSATLNVQKKKKWESSWVFSVFNVYSRMNPYFIYFNNDIDTETNQFKIQAKQVSLFPIIPSVTYNFKF